MIDLLLAELKERDMANGVLTEKTGWRDLSLSRRHREWGVDCPATDIDCLVEIARGIPVAIIEYKSWNADLSASMQSTRSLELLAERARIAFFLVRYLKRDGLWLFSVEMASGRGSETLHPRATRFPIELNELEFVKFLYRLRRRDENSVHDLPCFAEGPIL